MAVKTTLNLDDHLMRSAKKLAADRGVTLTRIIEDALRDALSSRPAGSKKYRFEFPVTKGGTEPPLDMSDRAAFYEWLES